MLSSTSSSSSSSSSSSCSLAIASSSSSTSSSPSPSPLASFWSSFLPPPSLPSPPFRSRFNAAFKSSMRRLHDRFFVSLWSAPSSSSSSSSSIWFLGVCYPLPHHAPSETAPHIHSFDDFQLDFRSRLWITYRKGFEAIEPANLTSDVGWGCMLRSGQMLLAQALVCLNLGRNWRWNSSESNSREYLEIVQCFGDSSSRDCPFSIHNILTVGGPYGLVAGSWLGPYALCRSLEAAARSARERGNNERLDPVLPIHIYVVSGDANGERGGAPCICIDDVASLCTGGDPEGNWDPVLLLVPLVLGLDKVNPRYLPSLWATFSFPQSVGMAGGKPGASTYLVGVQDDKVFYLDPHEVQQAFTVSPDDIEVDTSSYHCSAVKQMPLSAIDPSLALGFYCGNQEEFDDLCKRASELARESNGAPMFTIVQGRNKGGQTESSLEMQDIYLYNDPGSLDDVAIPQEEEWQVV